MRTLQNVKKQLAEDVSRATGIDIDINIFSTPPAPGMGDLAFPCFSIAKELKTSPAKLAEDLAIQIKPKKYIKRIKAIGPYVNFIFEEAVFIKELFSEIKSQGKKYGKVDLGKNKKIMVEYSQPNTHKAFHIGHIRNACLGNFAVNALEALGYSVISSTYVNDFGSHVGKVLWAFMNHKGAIPADKNAFMGKLYANATKKSADNESVKEQIADVLRRFQIEQDKEAIKAWKQTRKWSIDQFKTIYKELDIDFDIWFYESDYIQEGLKMIDKLVGQGVLKKSQGAIIADLSKEDLDVLVIVRSDGTSQYAVADIAMGIDRFKKFKLDKMIWVVDVRQSLYFKQLFSILNKSGIEKEMVHLSYEFVKLKSGMLSSRTGEVLSYDEVKNAMVKKSISETKKRHTDWSSKKIEWVATDISLAALKFAMLKQSNNKVITFDPEEALDFSGDTGPYVQYTLARLQSVLRKAGKLPSTFSHEMYETDIERQLIRDLVMYPEIITQLDVTLDPSKITHFLLSFAQHFNAFYHDQPILKADKKVRDARLVLLKMVQQVMENAMGIIGLPILKEM